MKHKYSAPRKALLVFAGLCALGLSSPLFSAEAGPGEPEEAWKKALAAKEEFYRLEPSSLNPQAFERFLAQGAQKAGALADQFRVYRQHYTNSPHLEQAWREWIDLLNIAAYRNPARKAELEKAEQQCLADPNLKAHAREKIRSSQINRAQDLKERERLVRQVKDEMESPTAFLCQRLLQIAEVSDYPHSGELVAEVLQLSEGKAELGYLHDEARQLKGRLDRIGHPLRLAFRALDGSEVDIEKLHGKVVLLEFWATWCPPCVAGIPQIKAAWEALHREGFEVIALSYDTERARLANFVKNNELPWPQFFAPEGMDAPLISSFGQPSPPSYWLIDRNGVLVDVNARRDLEQRVKRLLVQKSNPPADRGTAKGTVPVNRIQPTHPGTNQPSAAAGSSR